MSSSVRVSFSWLRMRILLDVAMYIDTNSRRLASLLEFVHRSVPPVIMQTECYSVRHQYPTLIAVYTDN